MAKATSRKHATHNKKARAHPAVKSHAQRSSGSKPMASKTMVIQPDAEIIDEELPSRSANRVDEDFDDEAGIYGANRGENAG
jgi:hypothetical protein